MIPKFNNIENKKIITSNKEYWISRSPAVVGVIFLTLNNEEIKVITVKRSNNMPTAPNKICLPCGYLDWNENGYNAMVREVYEETSLYLPSIKKYLVSNNDEQPFYVETRPDMDVNENVSLVYFSHYNFTENYDKIFEDIVKFKSDETDLVEIKPITDIHDLNDQSWAFNHNALTVRAFIYFKNLN